MPVSLGEVLVRFVAETAGFNSGVGGMLTRLKDWQSIVVGAGIIAGVSFAGAALEIGKSSVEMAGEFEDSLTKMRTVAGDMTDNLNTLGQGIKSVSAETGVMAIGTDGLSAAMQVLIAGGLRGKQALDALKAAAEGAKIEGGNVVDVAKSLSAAMTNYGDRQHSATEYMDAFVIATQHSGVSMQTLAGALEPIMNIAHASGISFGDLSSALATMTNEAIPANRAATSLRTMIESLESPTTKASKAMATWGVSTAELADKMHTSLPSAIQYVYDAALKAGPYMSQPWMNAISDMIGGQRSLQAFLALTGTGMEHFSSTAQAMARAMKGGQDSVVGWEETQADFNFQLERMHAILEVLQITIGQKLIPVIAPLLGMIVNALAIFNEWAQQGDNLVNLLKVLATVVAVVGSVFAYLGAQMGIAELSAVTLSLSALGPLGLVIAGLIAIVALAIAAFRDWDNIVRFFAAHFAPVGQAFSDLGSYIHNIAIPALQRLGTEIITNTGSALGALGAWLGNDVMPAVEMAATDIDMTLIPALQTLGDTIWSVAGPPLLAIAGWVNNSVVPALGTLKDWLAEEIPKAIVGYGQLVSGVLIPVQQQMAYFIGSYVGPAFSALGTFVSQVLVPPFENFVGFLQANFLPALQTLGAFAQSVVLPALANLWSFLQSTFGTEFSAIGTTVQERVIPALSGLNDFIHKYIAPAFQTFGTWIQGSVIPVLQTLAGFIISVVGPAFSILGTVVHAVMGVFGDIAGALGGFVGGAFRILGTWIHNELLPALRDVWSFLVEKLGYAFYVIGSTIHDFLEPALATLRDEFMNQLLPRLRDIWSMLQTNVGPAFSALGKVVHDQLLPALSSVWKIIQDNLLPPLQHLWQIIQDNLIPALKPLLPVLGILGILIGGLVLVLILGFIGALTLVVKVLTFVVDALVWVIDRGKDFAHMIQDVGTSIGIGFAKAYVFVQNFGNDVQTFFNDLPGTIAGLVQKFVDMVIGKFKDLWHQLTGGSIVPDMMNDIVDAFAALPGRVAGLLTNFVSMVIGKFQNMLGQVGSVLSRLPGIVAQQLSNAANSALSGAIDIVNNIAKGLSSVGGMVANTLSGLPGIVGRAVSNAAGAGFNAAVNVGSSIANGLASQIGNVANKAAGLAGAIANHLPHSPAKEGPLRDLDKSMPAMISLLVSGIDAGVVPVQTAMRGLFGGTGIPLASNLVQGVSSLGLVRTASAGQGQTINLVVDGRVLASALGSNMAQEIRLQLGVR